jgi:CO/xanthine dehydrogenase FAD-binding subunit
MNAPATFLNASSLDDALQALAAGARPIAGGTDLVVGARQGKAPLPANLVAIDRIEALRAVNANAQGLTLGSLVTHERIVGNATVQSSFTALADASSIVGSHATRTHGTIGGNVMTASPAMDTGGPLLCFGAVATLRSAQATRSVPLGDLFVGPGRTTAAPNELLISLHLPTPAPGTGSCYVRLEYRKQMEIAIVGATAVVTVTDGVLSDVRLAMTSLSPTIRRAPEAESQLNGSSGDRAVVDAAAAAFAAACSPISDVRASAGYRSAMAAVMCRRVILGAIARAKGETIAIPASLSLRGVR